MRNLKNKQEVAYFYTIFYCMKSESELASKENLDSARVRLLYSYGLVCWRLIFTAGRGTYINFTLYVSTTSSFKLILGSFRNLTDVRFIVFC
jgi:hypothetical protein